MVLAAIGQLVMAAAGSSAWPSSLDSAVAAFGFGRGDPNPAIAWQLVLSASAVEKHIGSIFAKRVLPPDDTQHRRVFAVSPTLRPDGGAAAPRTASSSDGGVRLATPQLFRRTPVTSRFSRDTVAGMTTPAQPSQFPGERERTRALHAGRGAGGLRPRDAGLLTAAVLLAAAFFLAPPLLVPGGFGDFPRAFLAYWSSGRGPDFPPGLQHLVDQQFRYHLVRVLIAVPLLAALVVLAVRLRRFRLLFGALALVAAALLILNVQEVVSPFGTLLSLLASGLAKPDHAAVMVQVRDQLAHGPESPALHVMHDQYVRWHVVKAVLSGLLTAALLGLSVAAWRRRHRWYSLLTVLLTAAALVVVVANVTTVANPDPGFLAFLQGSS